MTGKNVVTSSLEHPSAFDAVQYHAERTNREFRVVLANQTMGGIDVDEVMKYVDKDTCLLSIMAASNISGNIMNIKEITRRAKGINPDMYIISDADAPHAVIDVEDWGGMLLISLHTNSLVFVADMLMYLIVYANLPHHKLIHKENKVWALGTPAPANFAPMLTVIDYVCEIGAFYRQYRQTNPYVEGMNRIHMQERGCYIACWKVRKRYRD